MAKPNEILPKIIEAIESTEKTPLSLIFDIYNGKHDKRRNVAHPIEMIIPLKADEHIVSLGLAKKVYVFNYLNTSKTEVQGYYNSIFLTASDCRASQPYFDYTTNQSQPRERELWVYAKSGNPEAQRPMFEIEDMSPLGSVLLYIIILCAFEKDKKLLLKYLETAKKVVSVLVPKAVEKKFLYNFFDAFQVLMKESPLPSDGSKFHIGNLVHFRTAFQGIVEEIIPGLFQEIKPNLPSLQDFKTDTLLSHFEYYPSLNHKCPLIESFIRNGPFFCYTDSCYFLSLGLKYFLSISENPSEYDFSHFTKHMQDSTDFIYSLNIALNQLKNNRLPVSVHERIKSFGEINVINEKNFDHFKELLCFNPSSNQEWIGISLMEVLTRAHNSFVHDVSKYLNVPVKTITDIQAYNSVGFDFERLRRSLYFILQQNKVIDETAELLFRATLTKFPYTYILHPLIGGPMEIMRKRVPDFMQKFDSYDRRIEEIPMIFKRYLNDQVFFLTTQQISIINENIVKTGKTEGMKQLILYAMEKAIHQNIKEILKEKQEPLDAFFPEKDEMTITQLDAFNTYDLIKTSLETPLIYHACSIMDCLDHLYSLNKNLDLKGIKMICPEVSFRNWIKSTKQKQLLQFCKDDFETKEKAQIFISLAHKLMVVQKGNIFDQNKLNSKAKKSKAKPKEPYNLPLPLSYEEEKYYDEIMLGNKWSIPQFLFQFNKAREMLSLPGTI